MRIIAGQFKRRTLHAPPGNATRPSTDRARESMFNLLSSRIDFEDLAVLDLFSGTGALGLEAMSRGAASLIGVESGASAIRFAQENARSLDPGMNVRFVQADVFQWINKQNAGAYGLILADPPYAMESVELLPDRVMPLLTDDGLFVLEHDRLKSMEGHPACMVSRTYGKSAVSIFGVVKKG